MNSITIRSANISDCAACQRLGRIPEIQIAPKFYLPLQYYQRVVRGGHIFFVAKINERIVGFIIGEKIVSGILAQYLVVTRSFRGRGIGHRLLTALEGEARKRKAFYLLGYAELNSPAINRLFKGFGYTSSHVTREWSKGLTREQERRRKLTNADNPS